MQTVAVPKPGALKRALRARELAGDARAGSYARAMARREQRAFVGRNFWRLLCGWLLLMTITPGLWWFVASELLRGMVLGADLASATALVWFVVVQSTGTAPTMMGDEAEQWTAQELRKLGDWRLVNHFELSYGDMDHVAVGPPEFWCSRRSEVPDHGTHETARNDNAVRCFR